MELLYIWQCPIEAVLVERGVGFGIMEDTLVLVDYRTIASCDAIQQWI